MTGEELYERFHYMGMDRAIRRLAFEEGLDTAEHLEKMTTEEICSLVVEQYEVVYCESEEIGIVRKDKVEEYWDLVKVISR